MSRERTALVLGVATVLVLATSSRAHGHSIGNRLSVQPALEPSIEAQRLDVVRGGLFGDRLGGSMTLRGVDPRKRPGPMPGLPAPTVPGAGLPPVPSRSLPATPPSAPGRARPDR
jgi:hypothetical protein